MQLFDRLEQAPLRRGDQRVGLLYVDLDGFKPVNDDLGHAVGDAVLVDAAQRLRSVVREVDTAARLGGDEFVIICESLDDDEAVEVAGRIEAAMARPFHAAGETVAIGASAGVVTTSDPDTDITDLLGRADQAMYRAKQLHRLARERRDGDAGVDHGAQRRPTADGPGRPSTAPEAQA